MLQLRSVQFDRFDSNGEPTCMPVPIRPESATGVHDWEFESGEIQAIAFFIRSQEAGDATVTATFRALVDIPDGLSIEARDPSGLINLVATPLPATLAGASCSVPFCLPAAFATTGIDFGTTTWHWHYQGSHTTFAESNHSFFVVLGKPAPPWSSPHMLPWTEVLKVACRWTRAATTGETISEKLAAAVYGLGGQIIVSSSGKGVAIRYNQSGHFMLTYDGWNLAEFLRTANRERGARNAFNCSDAATAVSLLASALGVPLTLARITRPNNADMTTRAVCAAGSAPVAKMTFEKHEVACRRRADGSVEHVWDGCLHLDMDADPASVPTQLGLPSGVPLDSTSEVPGYRDRFLEPGQDEVVSSPTPTHVRFPFKPAPGHSYPPDEYTVSRARALLDGALLSRAKPDANAEGRLGQMLAEIAHETTALPLMAGDTVYNSLVAGVTWNTPPADWEVRTVTADSREDALELFALLGTYCDAPLRRVDGLADITVGTEANDFVLMLRGNTVIRMQAQQTDAVADSLATAIDETLSEAYLPPQPPPEA